MDQNRTDETASQLASIVAIAVGNSRVQIGHVRSGECHDPSSHAAGEHDEIAERVRATIERSDEAPAVVIASVNDDAARRIEETITALDSQTPVLRLGRDIPIHINHALSERGEQTVGQDRLMCAIAAYEQLGQACVVVDLGTAVTIDFVDGAGVFHGGAILPGIRMMLGSMHSGTEALPELAFTKPDPDTLEPGRQTDEAMMLGVSAAVRGAVRLLAERYAEYYGAYPVIIATGGDLGVLEGDELVESLVPDLQLLGIHAACNRAVRESDEAEHPDDD